MCSIRSLAVRSVLHAAFGLSFAATVAPPQALAASGVTSVRADACDGVGTVEVPWADAVAAAIDTLPAGNDPHVSTAVLLDPLFDGARAFHEPSEFRALTTHSWDFTPYVADPATITAEHGTKRGAAPHVLAGHALYGMGKQAIVLTVGSAIDEVGTFVDSPVAYWKDQALRISGLAAPSQIAAYYEIARSIPSRWNQFLASSDVEQAETIGAVTGTVLVVLAPASKGTGAKGVDRALGAWQRSFQKLLAKGRKTPPPIPASAGAMARRVYEASPKHPRWELGHKGKISKAPKNGQAALENSIEVNEKTRVGIDYETGEFVVFNRTHPHGEVWHGHVREWKGAEGGRKPLDPKMRSALHKSGRTKENGKIQPAPEWMP